MSIAPAPAVWEPESPPDGDPYVQDFPISESAYFVQKLYHDERGRLVGWAVIQMRRRDGRKLRVAVYDHCHGKGFHVHFHDAEGNEFEEVRLNAINCQEEFESCLDDAVDRVVDNWQINERRSDRGKP